MRPYAFGQIQQQSIQSQHHTRAQQIHKTPTISKKNIQLPQCKSSIKGVVGQAISFFQHNNISSKIKPKHIFDTAIKQLLDINISKRQKVYDSYSNQDDTNHEDKIHMGNQSLKSMKHNYKRSKYFAFQRLIKMNSESYGAYHKWLKEKRKIFPAIIKINKNSLSLSKQISYISNINSQQFLKQPKQQQQKTYKNIQKLMRKGQLLQKQRQIQQKQQQTLQYLFVTRTNLIHKTNNTSEIANNTKKLPIIKYPQAKNKIYKYFLGPGNNHEIIKRVLQETRGTNWIQTSESDTLFNLKWEQYTDKSIYSRLDFNRYKQLINHFQFHESISTKIGLVETLKQYFNKTANNMDTFNYVPFTFIFDWSDISKFQDQLKKFVYFYTKNHPDPERLSRAEKDYVSLSRSIWKQTKCPPNMNFDKNLFKKLSTLLLQPVFKDDTTHQYLWILKPNQLNRGRGIKIFSTLQQLADIIKQDNLYDTFVIQKYIEKPLLIKDRKFDIRVWVLLTFKGEAYFFEEGYIRTSCQSFNLCNQNQYIHLTNNAVQKNSQKYGIFQEGNQLSFHNIDQHLNKQKGYFKQKWLLQIKRICGLVIEAGIWKVIGQEKTKHNLNSPYLKETYRIRSKNNPTLTIQSDIVNMQKINLPTIQAFTKPNNIQKQTNFPIKKGTFEIFGFDYMIDNQQKVWLIQVNTNPCLETSSKLLQILIPRMLDDAFKIVLDPLFKLNTKYEKSFYTVEGYQDSSNMWSQINKQSSN